MNETQAERQQRAGQELAQKMKLERPVSVSVRQILRAMGDDLANVYAATGTVLDAGAYRDDFVGVLKPAYRKTSRFFGTQAEQNLIKNKDEESHSLMIAAFAALSRLKNTTIDEEITNFTVLKNDRTIDFINRSVPIKADQITQTNQKELEKAVVEASGELATAGVAVTSLAVGKLASKKFKESSLWRGNLIAADVIQNAAEGSKQIEAVSLEDTVRPVSNQELGSLQTIKEWHTQGDEKVRPAHRAVDLMRVLFRGAFTVAGELLRFPGDTSLGASLANIMNCRCSAIYFLEGSIPDSLAA